MKKLLAVILALTFSAGLSHAFLLADGPGSGNGDDGTLMLAKIKQEKGLDDFHTLLYAFERGTVPPMVASKWQGGIGFRYFRIEDGSLKPASFDFSDTYIELQIHKRGSLLSPISRICVIRDKKFKPFEAGRTVFQFELDRMEVEASRNGTLCSSSTEQSTLIKNNGLVFPVSTDEYNRNNEYHNDRAKDLQERFEARVYLKVLILIERPLPTGKCKSLSEPVNGVCSISYLEPIK